MASLHHNSALPAYHSSHHHHHPATGNAAAGGLPSARLRRAPIDRGVKRTVECPCAIRLYRLTGNDIAARSEYCSVVLGTPSVGINEAVRSGVLPTTTAAEVMSTKESESSAKKSDGGIKAATTTSAPSSSPAIARPIAVQLAWGDTTVWEVAHTALRAVRADVDAAYRAEQRHLARKSDKNGSVKSTMATLAEGEDEEEEEEAPYSTPLHRYTVELLTGSVNSLGQASIIPLCTVACRQVLPGHLGLLPVRMNTSIDYHTALYELSYNLGDPVFVTCTRTV
jgi:hypothetical protein